MAIAIKEASASEAELRPLSIGAELDPDAEVCGLSGWREEGR